MAKKFRVTIDGETYEVLVEEVEETPVIKKITEVKEEKVVEKIVTPTPSPVTPKVEKKVPIIEPGQRVLTAPLPGKILKVLVSPGSKVKKGDLLLTIEAMKMENEFFASEDGVVKEVYVTPGQSVETGGSLLLLEVGN
ncbi:MAG: biotin/lipoyl-binding protein [Caldisericia bacterium]|jgi:biotin carboxyl carrier protein|nr:biotin/lipoyl-binding protein [Caldisericia bacterium]